MSLITSYTTLLTKGSDVSAVTSGAKSLATAVASAPHSEVATFFSTSVVPGLSATDADARLVACVVVTEICNTAGTKVEAYTTPLLTKLLELQADKKMHVRPVAAVAAEALVSHVNVHAFRHLLPHCYAGLTFEQKWQTKLAALNMVQRAAELAPAQISSCLPDLIPQIANGMWDTKKEVKVAATTCMKKICLGNLDITPFIPALISCIARPDEVPECVHKLASTTFVKAVDAPTLSIMLPLLIRGLNLDKTSVKRQTAVIIDNMCKLVDVPEEAQLFLPRLLPLLKKVIDSVADPECRDVAARAFKTLKQAGGDDEEPFIMELAKVETDVSAACVAHKVKVDAPTVSYLAGLCHDLILIRNFDESTWSSLLTLVLSPFSKDVSTLVSALYTQLFQESTMKKKDDDDDDGAPILCDCEFSLAYGGMILLNNTRLKLKRGHVYGLCGPNGCGKSTLIKLMLEEIAPDTGEVKTGTKLKVAYFDQLRDKLNPEMSVSDYISEGREYIDISGKSTHVVTYLGNFMFSPDQSRAPIRTLSGGEQNRLLLARLFSLPANLLVLDEPTNDLDIESLELLEEMLLTFEGTVLIVSHDRLFMDNVVSSLLVFDGNGYIEEHVGGYSDWQAYQNAMKKAFANKKKGKSSAQSSISVSQKEKGLNNSRSANTFDESISHEERKKQKADRKKLEKEMLKLPQQIEADETRVSELQKQMAEDSFYEKTSEEQGQVYDGLKLLESQIDTAMTRWAEVEELLDNIAS